MKKLLLCLQNGAVKNLKSALLDFEKKKKYKIRKKNIVKKLRANVDLFLVNLLDVAVQSLRTDIKQDGIDRRVVRLSALHRHV